MAKVVMTAQVQDGARWEERFRTHGDIFKTYGLLAPVEFTVTGNDVALCIQPAGAPAFPQTITGPQTIEAMEFDGVKRETVRVYVLDRSAF